MIIGDINVVETILNLERSVSILSKLLDQIKADNPNIRFPSKQQIEKYNEEIIIELTKKYPSMGIKKK